MIRKDIFQEHAPGAKNLTLANTGESFPLCRRLYHLDGPVETTLSIDGAEIKTNVMIIADSTFPEPLLIGRTDVSKMGIKSMKDIDGTIGLDDDSPFPSPSRARRAPQC